jgi:hypothetical protein
VVEGIDQTLQRERQRSRRDVGLTTHGVGHRSTGDLYQRRCARIVHVDQARCIARQHFKQATLCLKVRFHVGMKIQVIAREVREDAGSECHSIDAAERERVGRNLHGTRSATSIDHLAQQALHFRRLGRRVRRFAHFEPDAIPDRSQNAAANSRSLEDRRKEVGVVILPIGPGDADDLETRARIPEEFDRGGPARGGHRDDGHVVCTFPGAGSSETTAIAPRSIACRAKTVPSACCPLSATNTLPG